MLHRAAFGVAAEQRALRSFQHFDALDVEQGGVEAVLAAEIDAVEIDADALFARGLVGVVRHDAANADRHGRLARFKRRDAQARNRAVGEVEQALDVAIFHGRIADHRKRDRRVLQVGFALQRGDDHDVAAKVGLAGEEVVVGAGSLNIGSGDDAIVNRAGDGSCAQAGAAAPSSAPLISSIDLNFMPVTIRLVAPSFIEPLHGRDDAGSCADPLRPDEGGGTGAE